MIRKTQRKVIRRTTQTDIGHLTGRLLPKCRLLTGEMTGDRFTHSSRI